jgi:hypothetical protein
MIYWLVDCALEFCLRCVCLERQHNQASGNLVRVEDGYATVTGDEFPKPLAAWLGRGEQGFKLGVRIPVWLCSSGFRQASPSRGPSGNRFSVNEKDETSLLNCFRQIAMIGLHSPF